MVLGICLLVAAVFSAVITLIQHFFFGVELLSLIGPFFLKIVFQTVLFLAMYYSATHVITVLNKKFPWKSRFYIRVILESIMVLVVNTVITFIVFLFSEGINHRPPANMHAPKFMMWFPFLLVTIIAFIVFEMQLILEEKKKLEMQKNMLEKDNIMAQYSALKNQVNPHFLFNSLNVLSTLIYKDVKQSDLFIREFSKVYRYILELNTEAVVPVKKELDVLNSYIFLQKIRYPENLVVHTNLDGIVLQKYVPPLALQSLVENAIKHNKISTQNPLQIDIIAEDDFITVSNNYQPRTEEVQSTGIGLKNLKEKYELISGLIPKFSVIDKQFVAKIPIINKNDD